MSTKKSPELKAIQEWADIKRHNLEALGLAWLLNPEQEKLRRELPFIAEALDVCLKHIKRESLDDLERKLKKDSKPFTAKQRRVQDAWARHNAKRRRSVTNPNHEPGTGRFLPKKGAQSV